MVEVTRTTVPFLNATGLTLRHKVGLLLEIVAGLAIVLGVAMLSLNHETLFGVFLFAGMALGIAGFLYGILTIRCPACGLSLSWHSYTKVSLRESGGWLETFDQCPRCAFRPAARPATPSPPGDAA